MCRPYRVKALALLRAALFDSSSSAAKKVSVNCKKLNWSKRNFHSLMKTQFLSCVGFEKPVQILQVMMMICSFFDRWQVIAIDDAIKTAALYGSNALNLRSRRAFYRCPNTSISDNFH